MSTVNRKVKSAANRTAEGAIAAKIGVFEQLERTLNSCLLWEDNFYCDGTSVAERLKELTKAAVAIDGDRMTQIIYKARLAGLRHAPQWCNLALAEVGQLCKEQVTLCLQRPDDAMELVALYWANGKKPLPNSIKRGIADYLSGLNEYQLAKYGSREGSVTLKDLIFLVHPRPERVVGRGKIASAIEKEHYSRGETKRHELSALTQFINGTLPSAETWENRLSAGESPKVVFTEMLQNNELGTLALIRNLRNIEHSGVDRSIVNNAITFAKTDKIFPFQIMQAARHAPTFASALDSLLMVNLEKYPKLLGTTVFLVDVSGSMKEPMSSKSDMNRRDGAVALAIMLRHICVDPVIVEFNGEAKIVQSVRGLALDKIMSQPNGSTDLANAISSVIKAIPKIDRVIVLTDEQSATSINYFVFSARRYMINVATEQNGIGYKNGWIHVDGFSANIIDFIEAKEKEQSR
jgi:60 kDa SS-A/Ro ribonucleoprotein